MDDDEPKVAGYASLFERRIAARKVEFACSDHILDDLAQIDADFGFYAIAQIEVDAEECPGDKGFVGIVESVGCVVVVYANHEIVVGTLGVLIDYGVYDFAFHFGGLVRFANVDQVGGIHRDGFVTAYV